MTSTAETFTPHGLGVLVDDPLQLLVDLVAGGQQVVQLHLAQHAAQRGLGQLGGRVQVVLDRQDGLPGSITRKKMTAFTLIDTLSRVMTSWGGTSMATVRRLSLAILSMNGTSSTRPGPLPSPPGLKIALVLRPSRKMITRSYSGTTRMNEARKKRIAAATTRVSSQSTEIMRCLPLPSSRR